MKFKETYQKAKVEYKALYVCLVAFGILILVTIPLLCFSNLFCYALGLYLGLTIGIINHILLVHQMYSVVHADHPKVKGAFNYMLRYLLYGVGLAICLLLKHFGYDWFNVFTLVAGYLIPIVILTIIALIEARRKSNEKVE